MGFDTIGNPGYRLIYRPVGQPAKLFSFRINLRSDSRYVRVRQVRFRILAYMLVRMCNRIDSTGGCWDAGADIVARNSNGGGSWFRSWSEFSDLRFSGSIIAEMARLSLNVQVYKRDSRSVVAARKH